MGVLTLHGLARTRRSMASLGRYLRSRGYLVANPGYRSRRYPVPVLADEAIPAGVRELRRQGAATIHAITHSMGGILPRDYLARSSIEGFARAVMLCPPNHGSELVDLFGRYFWFRLYNGPAGCSLGTSAEDVPARLGPVTFSAGVIAGNRPLNPIFSRLIPGENDGKVSVASTKVEGMRDHLVVACSHSFIMNNHAVRQQAVHFLENGSFLTGERMGASNASERAHP